MVTSMKAKWQSNEEEGGTSQLPIVEVISKVVEEGYHVTRTEAEHESNVEEVMSATVRAQVPFHLCNIMKYLIYFQFVRYMMV